MKNLLLIVLILSPLSAFASGVDVIGLLYGELLTIIALTVFILLIKWKASGKLFLAIILIVSVILAFAITGRMPYSANKSLVDPLCMGIPLISVLTAFFIFRRKFVLKRRNRG